MRHECDHGGVSDRIAEAMRSVPRAGFLPPKQQRHAGQDRALPIGHRGTCSQPTTLRRMLELLDAQPGQRVLDVGSGSGWSTALLAWLTAPDGVVLGVEIEPGLVEQGRAHLEANDVARTSIEQAVVGELGWPAQAPYDRILVSAESDRLPDSLVKQLGDGGRLVIPVAGRMTIAWRTNADVQRRAEGWYRFVPLRED